MQSSNPACGVQFRIYNIKVEYIPLGWRAKKQNEHEMRRERERVREKTQRNVILNCYYIFWRKSRLSFGNFHLLFRVEQRINDSFIFYFIHFIPYILSSFWCAFSTTKKEEKKSYRICNQPQLWCLYLRHSKMVKEELIPSEKEKNITHTQKKMEMWFNLGKWLVSKLYYGALFCVYTVLDRA